MKTSNKILLGLGVVVAFCALYSLLVPATCAATLAITVLTGTSALGANSGTRATAATMGLEQNSRVVQMDNKIYLLDPNKGPLIALMQKMRKGEAVANPKVEWLEDEFLPTSGTTSAAATSTATSISLTTGHGAYFRDRDVVKVLETGEIVYVTSVLVDVLTVKRVGIASAMSPAPTVNAAISTASTLLVLGNASEENATGRILKSTVKLPKKNYTQIFREPYGSSRTLANSRLYGGKDMPYQARMAGIRHEMNMERQFLWGEMAESLLASGGTANADAYISGGNYPLRMLGGVEQFVTTNITTDPTLTEDGLESFLETGLRYGGDEKIAVVSRKVMSYINLIAKARLQTFPTTTSFPLKLMEYISGHGSMKFLVHHQLTGPAYNATTNPNVRYNGYMFLLDFDSLSYVPFEGADTIINRGIQANDVDGKIDEYLTECTLKLIHERQHAIWRGIQGYA